MIAADQAAPTAAFDLTAITTNTVYSRILLIRHGNCRYGRAATTTDAATNDTAVDTTK